MPIHPPAHTVFRNVKDYIHMYGAAGKNFFLISFSQAIIHIYVCYLHPVYRLGDGVTDDTAAINAAISAGGRYGHGRGQSSPTAPAIIYFPAGTNLISGSITDYYFTQLIGRSY